jgi:hypothetical protein
MEVWRLRFANPFIDSHMRRNQNSNTLDDLRFPSLDFETRASVNTNCAAFHLNRRPQTLRQWASYDNGPIRPLRVNGRLQWPTDKLRELSGTASPKDGPGSLGAGANNARGAHDKGGLRAPASFELFTPISVATCRWTEAKLAFKTPTTG